MTLRAKRDHVTFSEFKGVNEVIDEVKLSTEYAHTTLGFRFNEAGEATRIPGKLLVSTGSTSAPVLTIASLRFTDRVVVISHASTEYLMRTPDQMSNLRRDESDASIQTVIFEP